jgi:hypothetical protein
MALIGRWLLIVRLIRIPDKQQAHHDPLLTPRAPAHFALAYGSLLSALDILLHCSIHTRLRDSRHADLLGLIECPVGTGREGRAAASVTPPTSGIASGSTTASYTPKMLAMTTLRSVEGSIKSPTAFGGLCEGTRSSLVCRHSGGPMREGRR